MNTNQTLFAYFINYVNFVQPYINFLWNNALLIILILFILALIVKYVTKGEEHSITLLGGCIVLTAIAIILPYLFWILLLFIFDIRCKDNDHDC